MAVALALIPLLGVPRTSWSVPLRLTDRLYLSGVDHGFTSRSLNAGDYYRRTGNQPDSTGTRIESRGEVHAQHLGVEGIFAADVFGSGTYDVFAYLNYDILFVASEPSLVTVGYSIPTIGLLVNAYEAFGGLRAGEYAGASAYVRVYGRGGLTAYEGLFALILNDAGYWLSPDADRTPGRRLIVEPRQVSLDIGPIGGVLSLGELNTGMRVHYGVELRLSARGRTADTFLPCLGGEVAEVEGPCIVRRQLSSIAGLFDPLGAYTAPIFTVTATPVVAVPEPGTTALFLPLAGLILWLRRSRPGRRRHGQPASSILFRSSGSA